MRFSGALLLLCTLLSACSTGYQKENGAWVWVDYNENVGKKVTWIPEADAASFRVLDDQNFAADRQRVYLQGKPIPDADPATPGSRTRRGGSLPGYQHRQTHVRHEIHNSPVTFYRVEP